MEIYAKGCKFKKWCARAHKNHCTIYFNKVSQEHKGANMAPKLTEEYSACSLIFAFFGVPKEDPRRQSEWNRNSISSEKRTGCQPSVSSITRTALLRRRRPTPDTSAFQPFVWPTCRTYPPQKPSGLCAAINLCHVLVLCMFTIVLTSFL